MKNNTVAATFFNGLQRVLPHHLLSRLVFRFTRLKAPWTAWLIKRFARAYQVDLSQAQQEQPEDYPTFNAFFTRALKPDARPVDGAASSWVSPADGRISQIGFIQSGNLLQAKGRDYRVDELLADSTLAEPFKDGSFATVYLSPRDYHRVHMPCDGKLTMMRHIPGRLFSVGPKSLAGIDRVFARNERLVCMFETTAGPMALVLVGAINVAAIETVWAGLVTPPAGKQISDYHYGADTGLNIALKKGQEMGRFNMGSTVIILAPPGVVMDTDLAPEQPVKQGELIAQMAE